MLLLRADYGLFSHWVPLTNTFMSQDTRDCWLEKKKVMQQAQEESCAGNSRHSYAPVYYIIYYVIYLS